ncbi:MAG: excinuclease ABC subunit A [Spirochaeta sp. LUC14_002_19_P3]|nr:MAG: excinuclease ABC subunit A [Spirochaeta sp. LUC14_002_19_P3]
MDKIIIRGAREHNLRGIDLDLPRDKLIVISGLSGSGKSSLAFDTIFAEGQRRYVESLSAYARQFLGRMDKPDVDYLEGLSPAISIEQKTTSKNPRSTVGTITEIYDYLRLLYARIGRPFCPNDGSPIKEQSVDQILDAVTTLPDGLRVMVLAPIVRGRKGEHKKYLSDAKAAGFVRVQADGEVLSLDEEISLDKNKKHDISIVVDRIKMGSENRKRLADALETALEIADGKVIFSLMKDEGTEELFFSERSSCHLCGFSLPELQPRLFSFNSPYGACPSCDGLGIMQEFDRELIMPDPSLSFNERGLLPYNPEAAWYKSWFDGLAKVYGFSLDEPLGSLDEKVLDAIFNGTGEAIDITYVNKQGTGKFEYSSQFKGIYADLERRYKETVSTDIRNWLEGFMTRKPCRECGGKRLNKEALCVQVGGKNIHETTIFPIHEAMQFFNGLQLDSTETHIAQQILKEIRERLGFLESVGLGYLTLERESATLSGGEAQRIRLATQIGSSLMGVLYILDEPTIGLHQRDNGKLIDTLLHLRDIGNTLIVVEHDEQTIRTADYIVDMGPGAGVHGGSVVAQGTLETILSSPDSPTGRFLSGKEGIPVPKERRKGSGKSISIRGGREHNLKNIDIDIPLGKFVTITGVSGSGKSTLLADILYPALSNAVGRTHLPVGECDEVRGTEHVDKVICIDQSPIGRTPRSNPATYVGLFTPVRDLFSNLPESKARGFKPGRFSFNVKGGRCEACEGAGTKKIEMHFLPDVYVTCDVCGGRRFNRETLEVRYKGKNIHEILEMTVEEALAFFAPILSIRNKLETLNAVGMSYIKLGQSAVTLSGGEAQRVKLSLELSKRSTGRTFYIIDEPTTGLHFADVKQLLEVLQTLVDRGNTICMIEHNLDVIKQADYIVDLGPEGGDAGGSVVTVGTPEEVAADSSSHTGFYLRDELAKS